MIRADEEFWDFERASFDDELDAWRARTAAPIEVMRLASSRSTPVEPAPGLTARRTWPELHPRNVSRGLS